MGVFVWILLVALFHLRSGDVLLEQVQRDDALWKNLGCPEKVHGRDFAQRFSTIRPLGP